MYDVPKDRCFIRGNHRNYSLRTSNLKLALEGTLILSSSRRDLGLCMVCSGFIG